MQYHIVLVNLDPTIGSETKKTRPCLVLSPNEMNKYLDTIVIAPITSTLKPYPTRIGIKNENINGSVMIDQIRTIDKQRLIKTLNPISDYEIKKIKEVIKNTFVD